MVGAPCTGPAFDVREIPQSRRDARLGLLNNRLNQAPGGPPCRRLATLVQAYSATSRSERLRSIARKLRLRRRIEFGVISISSSSSMNSIACSREKRIGGV